VTISAAVAGSCDKARKPLKTSAPRRMMKIIAEVSAVWISEALISSQPRLRWMRPTSSMAMQPTDAPSVGVKTPP